MSCCPPPPEIKVFESADAAAQASTDTEIRQGESVECYMARSENPSGLKDDLTDYPPDKIDNTDVPLNNGVDIGVQFRLTPGSTQIAAAWFCEPAPVTYNLSLTFGGLLTGTIPPAFYGRPITLEITANNGSGGAIDTRSYTFSAQPAGESNSVSFINPLPGSIITSRYGPRVHPERKTQSVHKGIDLALPGNKIADVVCAADGTVVFVGYQANGAGNYLKVDHSTPSGRICQTVYMHLEKIYVSTGQKVAAGQKIGREGNTGVSTGPHLHFECRIISPGGTKHLDPEPLIKGKMTVSRQTGANNQPVPTSVFTRDSSAALTKANVVAKDAGCSAYGAGYPPDITEPTPVPDLPVADEPSENQLGSSAFEQAWYFSMVFDVGNHWKTTPEFSPGDADLNAGSISTAAERKKTGYKVFPNIAGGEQKFGIRQGAHPGFNVRGSGYFDCKLHGYNSIWRRRISIEETKPKTCIMMFDLSMFLGIGSATEIESISNAASLADGAAADAIAAAAITWIDQTTAKNIQLQSSAGKSKSRVVTLLQYVKSLP